MIAELALAAGIAPAALLDLPGVADAMAEELHRRREQERSEGLLRRLRGHR